MEADAAFIETIQVSPRPACGGPKEGEKGRGKPRPPADHGASRAHLFWRGFVLGVVKIAAPEALHLLAGAQERL